MITIDMSIKLIERVRKERNWWRFTGNCIVISQNCDVIGILQAECSNEYRAFVEEQNTSFWRSEYTINNIIVVWKALGRIILTTLCLYQHSRNWMPHWINNAMVVLFEMMRIFHFPSLFDDVYMFTFTTQALQVYLTHFCARFHRFKGILCSFIHYFAFHSSETHQFRISVCVQPTHRSRSIAIRSIFFTRAENFSRGEDEARSSHAKRVLIIAVMIIMIITFFS